MEEKKYIDYYDEEDEIIKAPYWLVEYTDDCGYKHLATITNKDYLKYLQDNYSVINIKFISD